jgi:hypothetical protein
VELIDTILTYLFTLIQVISQTLRFDPAVWTTLEESGMAGAIVAGIVFLGGVSTLMGQSVVLFLNQVRKGRFVFSLVVNGLLYLLQFAIWGIVLYLVARILFEHNPTGRDVLLLIGLSTAPYVLGFLALIPYMGPFIAKLLSVWVFLLQVLIIDNAFEVTFFRGVIAVGLGWLVMLLLTNTVGKPVIRLRNWIWKRVSGSDMDITAQDILLQYSSGAHLGFDAGKEGKQ